MTSSDTQLSQLTQFDDLPHDIHAFIYKTLEEPEDRYAFRTASKLMYQNPYINTQITKLIVSSYLQLHEALRVHTSKPGAGDIQQLTIKLPTYDADQNYPSLAIFACIVRSHLSPSSQNILDYLEDVEATKSYQRLLTTDRTGNTLIKRIEKNMNHPLPHLQSLVLENCPSCLYFAEALDFARICPTIRKVTFNPQTSEELKQTNFYMNPRTHIPSPYDTNIIHLSILETSHDELDINVEEGTIIDDETLEHIASITSLRNLTLQGELDNQFHTHISCLTNLQSLNITFTYLNKTQLQPAVDHTLQHLTSLTSLAIPSVISNVSSQHLQNLFIENLDSLFAHELPALRTFSFAHIDASGGNVLPLLDHIHLLFDALPVTLSLNASSQYSLCVSFQVISNASFTPFQRPAFEPLQQLFTRFDTYHNTQFIEEIARAFPRLEEWIIEIGHDWILEIISGINRVQAMFPHLHHVVIRCRKTNLKMHINVSLDPFVKPVDIDIYSHFLSFYSRSPNVVLRTHPIQDYKPPSLARPPF